MNSIDRYDDRIAKKNTSEYDGGMEVPYILEDIYIKNDILYLTIFSFKVHIDYVWSHGVSYEDTKVVDCRGEKCRKGYNNFNGKWCEACCGIDDMIPHLADDYYKIDTGNIVNWEIKESSWKKIN